ncbi:MAG: EamA family transporter [Candidatus Fonsibacter ubiquis]|nr:EamA family transporter [Candidatus Fonsibacter ubiquis]
MNNLILFISTLICWSPTWYLIKFQFGVVDPLISIFYRFLIASAIVFIFLIIFKKKLLFNLHQHFWFLLLGVTLFSLNYIFFYLANTYLISGIVTIAFSTILIMNILGERIYFNIKSSKQTLIAAGFGIIGILIIFEKELLNFKVEDKTVVAFYLYLKLLESIGSARAGYMGVVMPIIALIISTIFEGLQWTNNLIFGLPVLIFGCVLILNQKSKNI